MRRTKSAKASVEPSNGRVQAFLARLQLLCSDHTSSSLALAHQAIDLAEDWLREGFNPDDLARELATMHPGMALITNLSRMLKRGDAALASSLGLLRQSLHEGNQRIAERLAKLVPAESSVITLSNSATVLRALVHIGVRSVYVMESRPGGEGVVMVEELQRHLRDTSPQSAVHLIESTTIGNVAPRVDCAVVGTDSISRSGGILHKVGTLPLALCCYYFEKPFYALGHSFKRLDYDFAEHAVQNEVPETENLDYTPAELITRIVNEGRPSWRAQSPRKPGA